MRAQTSTPLLVSALVLVAGPTANAANPITFDGTANRVLAPEYAFELLPTADAAGGVLKLHTTSSEVARRLSLTDGLPSCSTGVSRGCVAVVVTDAWVLLQCDRKNTCSAGSGEVDVEATTLLSFRRRSISLTTEATWSLVSGSDSAPLALEQPFVRAEVALPATNQGLGWLGPKDVSLQQLDLASWEVFPCETPMAVQLPYNEPWEGIVALATHATTSTAWGGKCHSSVLDPLSVTLVLGGFTPNFNGEHTYGAAFAIEIVPGVSADTIDPAVRARASVSSSPTLAVESAFVWEPDGDGYLEGLGIATLGYDAAAGGAVWETGPIRDAEGSTIARPNAAWLLRGALLSDNKLPSLFAGGDAQLQTDTEVHMKRVPAAVRIVANTDRQWRDFTPGTPMCGTGGQKPRICFQASSPFPFTGLNIELSQSPTSLSAEWEYWSSVSKTWAPLSVSTDSTAADLTRSGTVQWDAPAAWGKKPVLVDGKWISLYAVRLVADSGFSGNPPAAQSLMTDLLFVELRKPIDRNMVLSFTEGTPPEADIAQTNQDVALNESVELDGSASTDPDGSELAFTWIQSSGPESVALSDKGNAAVVSFVPTSAGIYGFKLTVSDGLLKDSAYAFVRAGTSVTLGSESEGCNCSNSNARDGRLWWVLIAVLWAAARARVQGNRI